MTSLKKNLPEFDPTQQLELLRLQCNKLAPYIYRVNAHYLDLVRKVLPQVVHQALFVLITENVELETNISSIESRKHFQSSINKLITECNSILTIEHLLDLASEIDLERKKNLQRVKEQIKESIDLNEPETNKSSSDDKESIYLSVNPPIENYEMLDGWDEDIQYTNKLKFSINNNEGIDHVEIDNDDLNEDTPVVFKDETTIDENADRLDISDNELGVLRSIFALARETIDIKAKKPQDSQDDLAENQISKNNQRQSNDCLLPNSPFELFQWLTSLEVALNRRLRNLSHSINVELLRSGLVNTLVPLHLLDAILSGQIHSENSESNLINIKVPINPSLPAEMIQISCLLIRCSELEFDHTSIRKSRVEIKKYRNLLLKMVKQQRYWQRRSLAEEVRNQWWQNPSGINKQNPS